MGLDWMAWVELSCLPPHSTTRSRHPRWHGMPSLICSDNTDECLFLPRQSNHFTVQCLSVFLSAGSYSDKFLSDVLLASFIYIHTTFGSVLWSGHPPHDWRWKDCLSLLGRLIYRKLTDEIALSPTPSPICLIYFLSYEHDMR